MTQKNRLLNGRYRLISTLGEGGMGVTYRAWDCEKQIPVVVKMPLKDKADEETLRRFSREIESMVNLRHDNIVPILDHGQDSGDPYVVMQLLPGGSLQDQRRVNPDGSFLPTPPGFLRFWLPGIADAIDFVHRHGMVHRDVKPGNIFFDGFWHAFLGDFGIAKVFNESGGFAREKTLTAESFAMGTEPYMAPELFLRTNVSGQVDQYALAITIYEMLSGKRPFSGEQTHIAVEHMHMKPPPLRTVALGLPPSLCAAVERALEKNPEDRFPTCAAFAAAAIQDVLPLEHDPGVARLQCPQCKTVLLIPVSKAGRSGPCPSCKSLVRITRDLDVVWLASEDPTDSGNTASSPVQPLSIDEEPEVVEEQPEGLEEAGEAEPKPQPRTSLFDQLREVWRRPKDENPPWLPESDAFMPFIAALVSIGVTHFLWSIHHEGQVEQMKRRNEQTVANLLQQLGTTEKDGADQRDKLESLRQESENARRLAAKVSYATLEELTSDEARIVVDMRQGKDLVLDGLKKIDDETAKVLSSHVGGRLSLNGLVELPSEKAAAALARHRGPVSLRGLRNLPDTFRAILRGNVLIELPPPR